MYVRIVHVLRVNVCEECSMCEGCVCGVCEECLCVRVNGIYVYIHVLCGRCMCEGIEGYLCIKEQEYIHVCVVCERCVHVCVRLCVHACVYDQK